MPKIIKSNRTLRPGVNWVDEFSTWKKERKIGSVIFFIGLDENGYPDETERWQAVVGTQLVRLQISGFQPVFRLAKTLMEGQYMPIGADDEIPQRPIKVLVG